MRWVLLCVALIALEVRAQEPTVIDSESMIKFFSGNTKSRAIVSDGVAKGPTGMSLDFPLVFESGSTTLSASVLAQLRLLAAALQAPELVKYRFNIVGHTDAAGSSDANRKRSEAWANRIKSILVANGVSKVRLTTIGEGESRLLYPHRPTDSRNRRIEIENCGNGCSDKR